MCCTDPQKRPCIQDILESPIFFPIVQMYYSTWSPFFDLEMQRMKFQNQLGLESHVQLYAILITLENFKSLPKESIKFLYKYAPFVIPMMNFIKRERNLYLQKQELN